jgi:hypothetical protein
MKLNRYKYKLVNFINQIKSTFFLVRLNSLLGVFLKYYFADKNELMAFAASSGASNGMA